MKTYTIKTPTSELLVVELPENMESDYSLIYGTEPEETYLSFRKNAGFKPPKKSEKLADGIWISLGKPDEITEEDARELVEDPIDKWEDGNFRFLDYRFDEYYDLFTAKESLFSLLDEEIYWNVNPIEKPNGENYYYEERHGFDGVETLWDGGSYNEDLAIFEEAEKKTFNRNRSIILKKNK